MIMKRLLLLTLLCVFTWTAGIGKITPTKLTCEYLKNPAVIDVKLPRLSWVNIAEKGERGK